MREWLRWLAHRVLHASRLERYIPVRANVAWAKSLLIGVIVMCCLFGFCGVCAQGSVWTTPEIISDLPQGSSAGNAWFPDIVVDMSGTVHAIWCWTGERENEEGPLQEQVMYARRTEEGWSLPNDIVPASPDIVRNALATGSGMTLHMLSGGSVYGTNRLYSQYYQQAFASEADQAGAWSRAHQISQGASYMGDIAVDSRGWIHVIYDDTVGGGEERVLSDIYYRRSTDGGRVWSVPVNLGPSPATGSARLRLEIDAADGIYVTWDEGWDRLSGIQSDTRYGVLVRSLDGGETWSPPTEIRSPAGEVVQLAVGSNGEGGVLLVWRLVQRDEVFYQWSEDGGASWSAPLTIPQIFARPWTGPFDMYDVKADSKGRVHLILVGRERPDSDVLLGVYHLVWDGEQWSAPTRIFGGEGLFPEYPRIAVHGDCLYAAWFTREGESYWEAELLRVWYASKPGTVAFRPSSAFVTPTAELVATAVSETIVVAPVTHQVEIQDLQGSGLPEGLYSEGDEILQLVIALSPILVLIVVLLILSKRRSRM